MLFQDISDVTNERDYATLMWWEQSTTEKDRFSQRILQQNRLMDGMLIASADMDAPLIDHLVEMRIPFVIMEKPTRHEHLISYVTIDNVQGAQTAVEHLIRLGCTRIGHITGSLNIIDAQGRLTSYRNTLQQHGIPFEPALVAEGEYTRESSYSAMKELLARDAPIDAVFAGNDHSAKGALLALQEANIRVPEDIALVGFDDVPTTEEVGPQLTRFTNRPMSVVRAAPLLLDIIEGKVQEP